MLVLSRHRNEKIIILPAVGPPIIVTIVDTRSDKVRIAVEVVESAEYPVDGPDSYAAFVARCKAQHPTGASA